MYEERKEKFSFKSFFLTILLVLLFIFLMLWLFPTKNYVDEKLQSTYDLERLEVLYDEIFANNVGRMKDAAIGYFTNERMPQIVGQSKKLTLQEMYNLHLVLKMKDKDGNYCHVTKSYVEMTKYTEEYRLKVNLSCGDQEDYIIVYLGCYNYCSNGICEKRVPTPSQTTAKEESSQSAKPTPNKPQDTNPNKPEDTKPEKPGDTKPDKPEDTKPSNPIVKNYLYEYKLIVDDTTSCSNWSNWQKKEIKETDLVKVKTKKVKEQIGYRTVEIPVTKTEIVTKQVTESYISKYITEVVLTGTKQVQVGTTTKTVTKEVQVGSTYVATGKVGTGTKVPAKTSTNMYKVISVDTKQSCSYCANQTVYTWEVYNIKPIYKVQEVTETVPVYKTINVYETKEIPVFSLRVVDKQEEVTKTTYETKKIPQYQTVTYYKSQTCKVNKGYTDIKWSNTKLDSGLIGRGYKLTGNVKEA